MEVYLNVKSAERPFKKQLLKSTEENDIFSIKTHACSAGKL